MPIRAAARTVEDRTVADRVRALLARGGPVTVLAPPPGLLRELTVGVFRDPPVGADPTPPIRVVAADDDLTALSETFGAGHKATELADRDIVDYRGADSVPVAGPLLVGPGRVVSVVGFERRYGFVEGDDALASLGSDRAERAFEAATRWAFEDRSGWRQVTTALAERTDDATLRTFLDALAVRRYAPAERSLDVVSLAILAGARTRAPQKAIADWCTACDIAAASTVSNRKSTLAEHGLVTTTRAPPDGVGAPVQELALADEYLAERPIEEVYDAVADVLTAAE
jgi:hypothetical protein